MTQLLCPFYRSKPRLIPPDRKTLLDELGFSWKQRERVSWDDRLAEVAAFKAKNSHCEIPVDKTRLGRFINSTRFQRNRGKLSADRIAKLDALGFVWKSNRSAEVAGEGINRAWKAQFDKLLRYKGTNGDCKVPYAWPNDPQLGRWVGQQRQLKKSGKLHPKREEMLQTIGFAWRAY